MNQATWNATVLGTGDYADIEILRALDTDGSPLLWDRYTPDAGACGWVCPHPDLGTGVYGRPNDYKPCERDITLDGDGVDAVGVQLEYAHGWITVLGLPAQTWHEPARARLEPDLFGTGGIACP